MGLDDLLQGMLGGSEKGSSGGQEEALGDLLEAMVGGGQQGGAGSADLEGLIGGILGGGGQEGGFGLDDVLGSVLGDAGGRGGMVNALADPIAGVLSDRLGLPRDLARTIVVFALGKFMGAMASGGQVQVSETETVDLDHLLEDMGRGDESATAFLHNSGLVGELVQETGLDEDAAAESLATTFGLIGEQVSAVRRTQPSNEPARGGLDNLLDSWD